MLQRWRHLLLDPLVMGFQLVLKVSRGQAIENGTEAGVEGEEEVGDTLEDEDPERGRDAVVLHAGLVLPDGDALVQAQDEPHGVADDDEKRDGEQHVSFASLFRFELSRSKN